MNERGAPTGMYQTVPEHLKDQDQVFDLAEADAHFVVKREGLPDVTLKIERPEFLIGRAVEGVDLTLDDDLVSRNHAKLTVNERGYFRLEDLGSTNGVHYEGRRVKRLNLVDGDVFEIGEATIEFHANVERFKNRPSAPPAATRPRQDSVFADIDIPEPRAESYEDEGSIGWDPRQAREEAMAAAAPPPEPPAEAGEDDGEG